ncbi:hypothetical protein [Streptomyces verrucosisporus]|uniref:hypothetical protein n=1 Tax=Streptomyces verrucosisporus TaxID=1695161 RepID=UPI0027DA49E1|nr:hypothetical protein [Streptomyces verrucosisporus]
MTHRLLPAAAALSALALTAGGVDPGASAAGRGETGTPRDFSGITWLGSTAVEGDGESRQLFLVCHDAKDAAAERDLPRLSIVRTPTGTGGIAVQELDVAFPDVSNDLESIARVPHRDEALLVESNDDGDDPDPTVYLARWDKDLDIEIAGAAPWPRTPEPLVNVEATAVATVHGKDYFLYAERARGSDTTNINMTRLTIGESGGITFGSRWTSVSFTAAEPPDARPASGLDVDGEGNLYISSAYDPGDLGPFDSAVYRAATIRPGGPAGARLRPVEPPRQLARGSGLKIEGVALVAGSFPLFIGADDEDYGGLLRRLRVTWPGSRP